MELNITQGALTVKGLFDTVRWHAQWRCAAILPAEALFDSV